MDLLGQQITVSLVVSVIISGILAIATFAVGIRVGKERSDRSTMRTLYKSLFDHFAELRRRIAKGEPKQWSDFPIKNDRYDPAMAEMERTGDINLLPLHIATTLTELERDVLTMGAGIHRVLTKEAADGVLTRLGETDLKSSTGQSPSTSLSIGALALRSDESFETFCSFLINNQELRGVGVGGKLPDGKFWTRFIAFDVISRDQAVVVLRELRALCRAALGAETMTSYRAADQKLSDAIETLSARIRDPHPFAETVLSLGRDLIDQSAR